MLEILLSASISCSEGHTLMNRVKSKENLDAFIRKELVREIRIAMPKNCNRRK